MSFDDDRVPPRVIGHLAGVFEALYTHAEIDRRFRLCGYEGSPPDGNKVQKVSDWLHRERYNPIDLLNRLGELVEDFMEDSDPDRVITVDGREGTISDFRASFDEALQRSGLRYLEGGKLRPTDSDAETVTSKSLEPEKHLNTLRPTAPKATSNRSYSSIKNKKIFLVHGHSESEIHMTARLVEKLGLTPIILREQTNSGATVIEKFEKYSDVGFAIILMTADDFGCSREEKDVSDSLSLRARQNVILELGYFIGKLGRSNVCVLKESGVEEPSDILGVVYTEFDKKGAWRFELCSELKTAGYAVDMNNVA